MVITRYIDLTTKGNCEIIDITPQVQRELENISDISNGIVTVFVQGATGGVTTIEYEPGLLEDLPELFDKLIPSNVSYHHDRTWHDGNAHSHLRASLLGPSLTVPFINGSLTLGTWQQIVFIDLDVKPRRRQILLQFIGE